MWNGFIGQQINRSNRHILLRNLALLAVPVAIVGCAPRYWQNFFAGVQPISTQALSQLQNPDDLAQYFVQVNGQKTIDTGVTQVTTRSRHGVELSKETSANYVALAVDQRLLLVKAKPGSTSSTKFQGSLETIPSEEAARIIGKIEASEPEMKGVFLPYMLQEQTNMEFGGGGIFGLLVGIPTAAWALWQLQQVGRRWSQPEAHPIAKRLAASGQDAAAVASQIEQELTQPTVQKVGKTTVTPTWLFRQHGTGLDVVKLDELLWIYQKVTQRRVNGVPAGKSYAVVLSDRAGHRFEIPASEAQTTEILHLLEAKAPWAINGYSDELQKIWNKDRAELVTVVNERRAAA